MIKSALIESTKLLENIIENIEDDDKTEDELISITHYIKALKIGCECDHYNGFDCGCSNRSFLYDEALKKIELIK